MEEVEIEQSGRRRLDYAWVIVALCFLMVFVCLGFCSSNRSLYLVPITEALGISRTAYSLNDSIRYLATAAVSLFFGSMVGRLGAKKVIGIGFLSLISSSLIYACATNVFSLYLGSIFLGVGLGCSYTTMVGYVISKWCREHRGVITGVVLAASGFGGVLATQMVSPLIYQEENSFGYRDAYKLIALILAVVGTVIMLLFREKAEETKEQCRSKGSVRVSHGEKEAFAAILGKPYFYLTAVCIFLTGFVLQGVTDIASAHMEDTGLDAAYIAKMVSIYSLFMGIFKCLIGALYDRFGMRIVVTICDMASLAALLALIFVSNSANGKTLALIYSVGITVALPLQTVMQPFFAVELFDPRAYAKMLGLFVAINTAGYVFGAPVLNSVFDRCGSYNPALYACCFIMAGVTVIFQVVIRAAGRQQRRSHEQKGTA